MKSEKVEVKSEDKILPLLLLTSFNLPLRLFLNIEIFVVKVLLGHTARHRGFRNSLGNRSMNGRVQRTGHNFSFGGGFDDGFDGGEQ